MNGDSIDKIEVNVRDGGMLSIAHGNSVIKAVQNNGNVNNVDINNSCVFQNNKKKEYINKWNGRLFLHVDNNENPLTLSDAFIMPDYNIYAPKEKKIRDRKKYCNGDSFQEKIERFVNYNSNSTMLITGVPGIGKSTIISWIANQYKGNGRLIILRFRDLKSEELKHGLLEAIFKMIRCMESDFRNVILALDGFDEITLLDKRETLLRKFINELKGYINIKVIITSRPAYINPQYFDEIIELQEFNIKKINNFYKKITGEFLKEPERIVSNQKVLGIPVILYMAIMSNVDISQNPTKPELYNCIFAEEGGCLVSI